MNYSVGCQLFGTAHDLLIASFYEQGRDHDKALQKVCGYAESQTKNVIEDKCLFRCLSIPLFCKVVSEQYMSLDPSKI